MIFITERVLWHSCFLKSEVKGLKFVKKWFNGEMSTTVQGEYHARNAVLDETQISKKLPEGSPMKDEIIF